MCKILTLLGVAMFLIAASGSQPIPRKTLPRPTEQGVQQNYAGDEHQEIADNTVVPVGGVNADSKSRDDGQAAHQKQKIDSMTVLTFFLVFFAFLQVLIYWNQYRAMVFSERAQIVMTPAVQNVAAPQAHFVFVIGQTAPATTPIPPAQSQLPMAVPGVSPLPVGLFAFTPTQHCEFRGNVLNIGNTPAYKLTVQSWMEIIHPPFSDFPAHARISNEVSSRTVYPNTPQLQFSIIVKTDNPLTQLDYDEFQRGQRELWVRVRVYYKDLFRKGWFRRKRFAEFGWRYNSAGVDTIAKYQDSN